MRYFVQQVTAVLFADYDLANKLQVASAVDSGTGKFLDGEPVLLPLPEDAPREIPRVVLTTKDQHYRCSVAPSRLELVYGEPAQPARELNEIREQYLRVVGDLATTAKDGLGVTILRLGLIVATLAYTPDPARLIQDTFIREGTVSEPHQLQLHVLARFDWDNVKVNRWCRLSSVSATDRVGTRKALSAVVDLNTVPEERYDFGAESATAFFDRALTYASENLGSLFPSEA